MTINFGPGQIVTLVADDGTPPELTGLHGIRLVWPVGLPLPAPAARDTIVAVVANQTYTMPGYLRTGGDGGYEWVLQPPVDPVVAALNSIPGADGWQSEQAKGAYATLGQTLLDRGLSLTEAKNALTAVYQAAVTNYVTAHP